VEEVLDPEDEENSLWELGFVAAFLSKNADEGVVD